MYEEVIVLGSTTSGDHLKEVGEQLNLFAGSDKRDQAILIMLHDLFASVADALNARFASSGEILGV